LLLSPTGLARIGLAANDRHDRGGEQLDRPGDPRERQPADVDLRKEAPVTALARRMRPVLAAMAACATAVVETDMSSR
jgi:hypothetical protein